MVLGKIFEKHLIPMFLDMICICFWKRHWKWDLLLASPQTVTNFTGRDLKIFFKCQFFRMTISAQNRQSVLFIDSLNFLLCSLDKLPKTFGLATDVKKAYFPHFFNIDANLNEQLDHLPAPHYYGMEGKSPEEYKKFLSWHNDNEKTPFCLRSALLEYCEMDVRILREACAEFRRLLIAETDLDPFAVSATLAKLTMIVYQYKFLPERTLVNIPGNLH